MTLRLSDITGTRARRKYGNQPVQSGTAKFGSKKELRRYRDLLILERAKMISKLKRQVPFKLPVNGLHVCTYIADATYIEAGKLVVEDTKSPATRREKSYRLKVKLMKAVHGIAVREV